MRLRDLDRAKWAQIARDLDEMLDDIATDDADAWPEDRIAADAFMVLNRGAILARVLAANPMATKHDLTKLGQEMLAELGA